MGKHQASGRAPHDDEKRRFSIRDRLSDLSDAILILLAAVALITSGRIADYALTWHPVQVTAPAAISQKIIG